MMQLSTPPPPDKTHQQRVVIVVGSYVLLWLTLWYVARIADVLGGVSLWTGRLWFQRNSWDETMPGRSRN